MQYLKSNKKMKRADLNKLLNIGSTKSKQIITRLLDSDLISKEGGGRSTYYILK